MSRSTCGLFFWTLNVGSYCRPKKYRIFKVVPWTNLSYLSKFALRVCTNRSVFCLHSTFTTLWNGCWTSYRTVTYSWPHSLMVISKSRSGNCRPLLWVAVTEFLQVRSLEVDVFHSWIHLFRSRYCPLTDGRTQDKLSIISSAYIMTCWNVILGTVTSLDTELRHTCSVVLY